MIKSDSDIWEEEEEGRKNRLNNEDSQGFIYDFSLWVGSQPLRLAGILYKIKDVPS